MATAGPVVNFVIALLLYVILSIMGWPLGTLPNLSPSHDNFIYLLAVINLFIGLFNLIPAFPMDGGRILRALLAYKLSRTTATRIASTIGQLLAVGFIFIGIFYNIVLIVIGVFIFLGAKSEWLVEHSKYILSDHKVGDIVMHQFHRLQSGQTLEEATAHILDSSARSFLVLEENKVVGTLSRNELLNALSTLDGTTPVKEIMNREFRVLDPDTPLTEVYNLQKYSIHAETPMPVVQDDCLLGVLDIDNISEFIEVRSAVMKKERSAAMA